MQESLLTCAVHASMHLAIHEVNDVERENLLVINVPFSHYLLHS